MVVRLSRRIFLQSGQVAFPIVRLPLLDLEEEPSQMLVPFHFDVGRVAEPVIVEK